MEREAGCEVAVNTHKDVADAQEMIFLNCWNSTGSRKLRPEDSGCGGGCLRRRRGV